MPQLRPLVLVLKYFLLQKGLNETYLGAYLSMYHWSFKGGLGSYTLLLSVVSFLQVCYYNTPDMILLVPQAEQRAIGGRERFGSTAKRLFWIFWYWISHFVLKLIGLRFNYYTTGIDVNDGGSYYSKIDDDVLAKNRPYLLSIRGISLHWILFVIDPSDPENDVGKNSFKIMNVRTVFSQAYAFLTSKSSAFKCSPLARIISVWPDIVLLNS